MGAYGMTGKSPYSPFGATAAAGGDSTVTPPADTIENVDAGASFSAKTFGSFTDPDGIIASYEAVEVNTFGSTTWSGTGLGPYTPSGEANGSSGVLYLRAKDAADTEVARAVHAYSRGGADWSQLPAGSVAFDDANKVLNNGADLTDGVLTVDGINQYLSIPDDAQYDVNATTDKNFMLQFDFNADALYPTAGTDQYAGPIKKGNTGYSTGYAVFFLTASTLRITTGGTNTDVTPSVGISVGTWYRFRMTHYDFPSVGTASIVIRFDTLDGNGNPQNGFPIIHIRDGANLITNATEDLVVGYNNASSDRYFDGQIKNVIINNDWTD